jgi:hypothetical protein
MTIREYLEKQKLIGLGLFAPFFVLFVLFFHHGVFGFGYWLELRILGVLWIFCAATYVWQVDCPNCGHRLGSFVIRITRTPAWGTPKPAHCPYCYFDVDAQLPAKK